jgi:ankyrin repeat protein
VEPTPASAPKPKKSLVKAAKDNNVALMDELLRSGAGLEDLGMWDNTPLLAACTYGHAEAALRLISAKANVCAQNEHGATPMHYAAVEGMQSVVEALLLAHQAESGDANSSKLVNCGHVKVYNRHLDAYAMRTPLISAAESGFAEVAAILLSSGAVLEDPDEDGRTALWLAARHSRLAAVRLLLQNGADTDVKDSKGVSVLEASMADAKKLNEDLVLALLNKGISDVNDTAGSPLRDAVKSGKRAIAEALLTHGASIELKPGSAGSMPLHAACEKGDEYLVGLLVRSRADPSSSDAAGLTAFDLLRRRGLPDGQIVQLLTPPSPAGGGDGSTGATADTAELLTEAPNN